MTTAIDEIVSRCRSRLEKIESTKDEGVFARMYAEDVRILLDFAEDRQRREAWTEIEGFVFGGEPSTQRERDEARQELDDPDREGFRALLLQELAWHATGGCDCMAGASPTWAEGCRERARQITVELGLRPGR